MARPKKLHDTPSHEEPAKAVSEGVAPAGEEVKFPGPEEYLAQSKPVAEPALKAAPKPRRYCVLEPKKLSISGQILQFSAGDVVSEESYGPAGIDALLSCGVKLHEV